jgi:serine/threonine-protein kinase
MLPERIGRYKIKGELGRGGMATVLHGFDTRFKREVAIKVLPREFLHDPAFRARFEREAQTIAALEHPAIVPVYDFGEEDGQPYIVMRLMTGGTLNDRLRRGPLTLAEAARIVSALAPALDEAHARGIIHRDLKPGNILFDQRGDPYISDFGIAKLSDSSAAFTGSGVLGTPAYMSPEQARGERDVDGRSDIYSLGAILFQLLTGKPPYEADTPMGVVVKHLTEPTPNILETNPNLPPTADRLISKAMAKDKRARFRTAGDMATLLTTIARGEAAGAELPAGDAAAPPSASGRLTGSIGAQPDSVAASASVSQLPASLPQPSVSPMSAPASVSVSAPNNVPPTPPVAAPPQTFSGTLAQPASLPVWAWLVATAVIVLVTGLAVLFASNFIINNAPAAAPPTATLEAAATNTAPPAPTATTAPAPTATTGAGLYPTSPPAAGPTATMPPENAPISIILGAVVVNADRYVVEYHVEGFEPSPTGTHMHFFFDTVPPDQAGAGGLGPYEVYAGPNPFTRFRVSDRPAGATAICALVANPDHSVRLGSGNCVALP